MRLLQAPKLAAVEQLRERKRKAVEVEDYELLGFKIGDRKQTDTQKQETKRNTELSQNADHLCCRLSTRR